MDTSHTERCSVEAYRNRLKWSNNNNNKKKNENRWNKGMKKNRNNWPIKWAKMTANMKTITTPNYQDIIGGDGGGT